MHNVVSAQELVDLRRSGRQRVFHPEELPTDVSDAYRIAAETIEIFSSPVAAWKLGATTAETRHVFATEEIYFGALICDEIRTSGEASSLHSPLDFNGEAEIAFRLASGTDFDADARALHLREPESVFDAWAPAIEAPYSCVRNLPQIGLNALLMDRCAAGALYLGAPEPDIFDPAIGAQLELVIDGEIAARGAAKESLVMPPVDAAMEFLRIAAEHGVQVAPGQWISTGGITACIEIPLDIQTLSLRLGGAEAVSIKFESSQE